MREQFVIEKFQTALIADSLGNTVPMTKNISTQSEIGSSGGVITYSKGSSILRMMEISFGSELYIRALQNYLKNRFKLKNL